MPWYERDEFAAFSDQPDGRNRGWGRAPAGNDEWCTSLGSHDDYYYHDYIHAYILTHGYRE